MIEFFDWQELAYGLIAVVIVGCLIVLIRRGKI